MEESDAEDVASRSGPESWGSVREDGVQALTGVRVGWVLSREIRSRVPTTFAGAEGNTGRRVNRECRTDPARSKTPCMHGTSTRENREILGRPAAEDGAAGGPGKA
jgi:RNA-directed DNA polymerase